MGRFNLNQILSDTSKAAAGGGSAKPRPSESRYEKLSVFDLVPSEDNFYSMREIGELKAAIEIAGKVLQNLVVVPLGDGKYKVIAGHRRRLASIELVNDGKPEYEFVPCVIEPTEEAADEQEIRDGLDLIVTNSQREKTAWDKIEEVRYLREVLEKAKTKPRFVELLRRIVEKTFEDGELQTDGTRDFIAKVLHTSTTQIGRYDTIIRHLSPEFTEELKADRINLSTAYELAGLPVENQNAAFKEYHLTGAISIKAAREWKRPAPPAPPAENTATPTQAERPQKEREPVVERDKVPDTQAAAEEAERFSEAAMILAERAGISAEEAIYRIQEAVQVIRDEITSIADALTSAVEKFITQVEEAVAQAEPKHRRRKRQRERAALIERRYMVQIRHYERAHPFRRVYKPP